MKSRPGSRLTLALLTLTAASGCDSPTAAGLRRVAIEGASDLWVGTSLQLRAVALGRDGDGVDASCSRWSSSDPAAAPVSDDGRVEGVAVGGPVTIAVTCAEGSAATLLSVTPVPVASVVITAPVDPLVAGDSVQLGVVVLDALGSPSVWPPIWTSSDRALATVSYRGFVRGVAAGGPVTITATAGGTSGSLTLSVEPTTCVDRDVALEETVFAMLTHTDCRLSDGAYASRWRFTVEEPTIVRAVMRSGDVDPYLRLWDGDGVELARDDDSGGGRDAWVSRPLPPGSYTVEASTYFPRQRGSYSLDVGVDVGCTATREIVPGTVHADTLDSTDCGAPAAASYSVPWRLSVAERATVTIDLSSDAFDTLLYLHDRSHQRLAWNDDAGPNTFNSRIELTLDPGEYRVSVEGWGAGATGPYELFATVAP